MDDKRIAYALIVIGVVAVLVDLLIDPLRGVAFYLSAVQIIVLIVGIVVAAVGVYLGFIRKPPAA
mgnify:CR=1 FL=1